MTEPGSHVDEDTGEEYDMLWYEYECPDTGNTETDASQVREVREWVRAYDAAL